MASNDPILVVGGCGFLGYHLVQRLLKDQEPESVFVLDRRLEHRVPYDVTYFKEDICDADVKAIIESIQPRVIFHAASPNPLRPEHGNSDFYETNIKATQLLLQVATEVESVEAFVFTSTIDVYADPPHDNIDETHPLWNLKSTAPDYYTTKAEADKLVLAANGPHLRTVCLRTAHHYGERDNGGIPAALDAARGNRKRVQIGDGKNLFEVVSMRNAADAHVLAAQALLQPDLADGKVDGEAFNISDDHPVPFWYHFNHIWKSAAALEGHDFDPDNYLVVPAWVAVLACRLMEWLYWIFTLGLKKPPPETQPMLLAFLYRTHTYRCEKVKKGLGYAPVAEHDEVVRQAVEWELGKRKGIVEGKKLK